MPWMNAPREKSYLIGWKLSPALNSQTFKSSPRARPEEEIESHLSRWIHKENIILIAKDPVNADILSYIHVKINTSKDFQERWSSSPSVLEEIVTKLGERTNGM
jgi:hypothetical protein